MKALLVVLLIGLTAPPVFAQDQSNGTAVGFPASGRFDGSAIDSVQVNNGNLHIQIPVWTLPGRGVSASSSFIYDSKGWYLQSFCGQYSCSYDVEPETGSTMQMAIHESNAYQTTVAYGPIIHQICHSDPSYYTIAGYTLREPNGTKHHLVPDPVVINDSSDTPCWKSRDTTQLYADDGSGYTPNGSKSGGFPGASDSNGNAIGTVDTLGRTISADGTYYDAQGNQHAVSVVTESVSISTHLCNGLSQCAEATDTWTVPHIITLPNGLKYTIEYVQNDEGEVSSITLPTGAVITYTYQSSTEEDHGGKRVQTRTVTANGQVSTWTYTYSYASPGNYALDITVGDPVGNSTVYTCTGSFGNPLYSDGTGGNPSLAFPCVITKEQDHDATGTLIKTVDTVPSAWDALPASITTTWALTNQVAKTEFDYETITIPLFPDGTQGPATAPVTWGNVAEKREYDFGSGSPGPLLRRTDYTYLHTDTSVNPNVNRAQYLALNIADRPTSEIVYDSSGNTIAKAYYYYDETSLISTLGNPAVGHDYTNYGSSNTIRGNLTRVSRWNNATGAWIDTKYTYDDLGNRLSVQDPLGHTTSYDYTDAFVGASCNTTGSPSYAFATTVTAPAPFNFETKNQYYHCTSQLQSSRNQNDLDNARNGTVYTYDLMGRLSSRTNADGGSISINYGGSAGNGYQDSLPFTVTKTEAIDSSKSRTSVMISDSLGRIVHAQQINPEGTTVVDTSYDLLGNVATASNPYLPSLPQQSDGTTSYSYDLFDRVVKATHPDGSISQTRYAGSAVETIDEGNGTQTVKRVLQRDALNRLVSVCEVSASVQQGATNNAPSACGQAIQETGFLTSYSHTSDSSGYSYQTVTQPGLQNRVSKADSLGRLVSAFNPEVGTTTYHYNNDSLIDWRTRPRTNQQNASVVTTTQYAYDNLHRITQVSYDDGSTPTSYFNYDEPSLWGRSLDNPKYHRTSALVGANGIGGSGVIAAETYSYDPVGRVKANDQCTPAMCSSGHASLDYSYDYIGDELSATDGAGHTNTITTDAAGRLLTAANSFAGTILSSIGYGPLGQTGANWGTAIRQAVSYDNRGAIAAIEYDPMATAGTDMPSGTLVINGTEQSTQVLQTPAASGSASVTITGSGSQKKVYDPDCRCFDWVVDTGSVNVTINGFTASGYTESNTDTAATVANSLANSMNVAASPVTATVSGSTVTFTAKATGSATNYPISVSMTVDDTNDFNSLSFDFSNLPSVMTGGQDQQYSTVYDTGTATATVNGYSTSVSLGQGSTPQAVANALAQAMNADPNAPATAQVPAPGTLFIISKTTGSAGNFPYSFSSAPSNSFSNPSFNGITSGGTLQASIYRFSVARAPDGAVLQSTDTVNGTWTYGYDEFNRLTAASSSSTSLTWDYDRYGNRWNQHVLAGSAPQPSLSFATDGSGANQPFGYAMDAAGNLMNDGSNNYVYDAESRLICAGSSCTANTGTHYTYDADGRRVAKSSGSVITNQYLYDLTSHSISELDGNSAWIRGEVYAGGMYVGTLTGTGLTYGLGDWLGTMRLRMNTDGSTAETITSLPFGDGLATSGPDPSSEHFTGKLRDNESGLDYFGARYYTSTLGRFMSPDWNPAATAIPYADLSRPQTLNLYAYVGNNPVSAVDSDGHDEDTGEAANLMKPGAGSALTDGVTLPSRDELSDGTKEGDAAYDAIADLARGGRPLTGQALLAEHQAPSRGTGSGGTGLWKHLSNLFHGHSWNYGMRMKVTATVDQESVQVVDPNDAVALGADTAGLASAAPGFIPGAPGLAVGFAAGGVSVANDPSNLNTAVNGAGAIFGTVSYFYDGAAIGEAASAGGFVVAYGALVWDLDNAFVNHVLMPMAAKANYDPNAPPPGETPYDYDPDDLDIQ